MVDDTTPTMSVETKKGIEVYDRARARREVATALAEERGPTPTPSGQTPAKPQRQTEWDPETWGLLPEHQRAQRAALAFATGTNGR